MNRRISIIVMNKKTEQHILQEAGNKPTVTVNDAQPAATQIPSDKPPANQPNTESAKH